MHYEYGFFSFHFFPIIDLEKYKRKNLNEFIGRVFTSIKCGKIMYVLKVTLYMRCIMLAWRGCLPSKPMDVSVRALSWLC